MHRRSSSFAIFLATALLALGCDNSGAAAQEKVNQAQMDADKASAQARADAEAKSKSAQADADKKIVAVQADFAKSREDYRHAVQIDLDALDKKLGDLETKSKTLAGKARTEMDAKLGGVRAQRGAFVTDFKTLDTASASNWDVTKSRLDKAMVDLKAAVDRA